MEYEQPIGVAVGIGEVVALAAARGYAQIHARALTCVDAIAVPEINYL
jgi:hypothetical protein